MSIEPVEIEIAKCGKATATNGTTVDFTQSMLHEVANSYDPELFQAPLIITHDTKGIPDNKLAKSPFAYGSPDYLRVVGDRLKAVFTKKIPEQIINWYKNGHLLSVSPSFYPPDSPYNPKPGKVMLRHIAALGSEPPSIKGLSPINFSEEADTWDFAIAPDDALDFSCACQQSDDLPLADIMQKAREFLIAEQGMAIADRYIPYSVVQQVREEFDELQENKEEYYEEETPEMPESDEPYSAPYYSYKEGYEPKKAMPNTNTKHHSKAKKMAVIDDPMANDTSALEGEEYEEYEDDEDMEDMEEMPPVKSKKKSKSMDYSEPTVSRKIDDLYRELDRIKLDFSEREDELLAQNQSALERALDAELANIALEQQVAEIQQNFAEKEEELLIDQITDFVEDLEKEGKIPSHLNGDYAISFSEDDETLSFTEALVKISKSEPEAFDVIQQFLSELPGVNDRVPAPANFGEGNPRTPKDESPVQRLGLKVPATVNLGDRPELQACLDYAEANNLDFGNDQDRKQILRAVLDGKGV